MKISIIIFLFLLFNVYLSGQVPLDSLPTLFYSEEGRSLNQLGLTKNTIYRPNVKGMVYYSKKRKGIKKLFCQYDEIKYLTVWGKFDTNLLKCIKDSLKHLEMQWGKYQPIDFKLNALEEIVDGEYDLKFLASLFRNAPNITYLEIDAWGDIAQLEDIAYDKLRYMHVLFKPIFCSGNKNLKFPSALLNAPNLEVLNIGGWACKSYWGTGKAGRYFKMPEITSDTLPLKYLSINVDIADPFTLEQIKKFKQLEALSVGFSGGEFIPMDILDQLKHIPDIDIDSRNFYLENKNWSLLKRFR